MNHRCEGSLKSGVSINYAHEYEIMITDKDKKAWRLFHYVIDSEWDCIHRQCVCRINICPFCGEVLKEVIE